MSTKEKRVQVVNKMIKGVGFSLYSAAEVRAVSVKQIITPILLDILGHPVAGGLYDPALGPFKQSDSCSTCGESALQCTGHFGHIELALPVYNPLVFAPLVKILKHMCIFCYHFKMNQRKVKRYADQLESLRKGHEIIGGVIPVNAAVDAPSSLETLVKNHHETKLTTSWALNAIKDLLKRFMEDMPRSKCENCEANVPTLRSEGNGKIFQSPLTKSKLSANIMNGHRLDMAMIINEASDGEKIFAESMIAVSPTSDKSTNGVFNAKKDFEATLDLCAQLRYMTTLEVKVHINRLWSKEKRICSLMWDALDPFSQESSKSPSGSSDFFLEALLVLPNRFRPPNQLNGVMMEHPMNILYTDLLQANLNLMNELSSSSSKYAHAQDVLTSSTQLTSLWLSLQNCTNKLIDSSTAFGRKSEQDGVRQLLERKGGLFRMNLMGKRVNYSCRSVISPDPFIATNEIGIPPYFATRLTYPEKVTHWNVNRLREAVSNGCSVYPGATHVENELGVQFSLQNYSRSQLLALSKTLLSTPSSTAGSAGRGNNDSIKMNGKIVYRHLQDGDILLVNRQPTLHKPSLMGHLARVLKGEKTLRLHYANCSTYNADFDGDEMNVHFPQDEVGRAEAYQIVNANQQFAVPTSGNPIRGLIQDHIVGGTLLTIKDRFFTREQYHELVYSACTSFRPVTYLKIQGRRKVGVIERDPSVVPLPPTIQKPKQLWTGKQVISTILGFVTSGRLPYTIKNTGKVSGEYWGRNNGEAKLRVKANELLHGVIDKAQFGKYGMVHAFKEFYGADAAGELLSIFSRLFTTFLQMYGFTCGISDLLLVPEGEEFRQAKLALAQEYGPRIHKRFTGLEDNMNSNVKELKLEIEKNLQTKGSKATAVLDRLMMGSMNMITSEVNLALLPNLLHKPFPSNCLSLMTTTGAKGGQVNFYQISSLLGQQELEGKRVPRMSSGKTLPCFSSWDMGARAGGFICDRFLSGLRPQEYYFHCMAGRDGLVDTAVKTARSGYLQRCLIKNLECLKVHYDYTVRDSDDSIIQFRYGEDGIDVMKNNYLTQFKTLAANRTLLSQKIGVDDVDEGILQDDHEATFENVSEDFYQKLKIFLKTLPKSKKNALSLGKQKQRVEFKRLMKLNYISSCAEPGEPVGVLAAQSIGEPSTQMTLNTFHLAGRGEMNVTLGIPRLREIFMTAAKKISTPVMTCPLLPGKTREDAERLAAQLRKIRLIDVIEKLDVGITPFLVKGGKMRKMYVIKLNFFQKEHQCPLQLQTHEYEIALHQQFIPMISKEMGKAVAFRSGEKAKDAIRALSLSKLDEEEDDKELDEDGPQKAETSARSLEHGAEIDENEEDIDGEQDGADAEKRRAQETDERAYDEEADDEDSTKELDAENDLSEDAYGELKDETENEVNNTKQATVEAYREDMSGETNKATRTKVRSTAFDGSSFEMRLSVKHNTPHILLSEIVEKVAKQVTLRSIDGIDRVSAIDLNGDAARPAIQAEGINFEGIWSMSAELDVNELTTNSIGAVLEVYGVEAAHATLLSEVTKVFRSYGISVDVRHLSLIADFMTRTGGFCPCNRVGIGSNTSPFLKMSFETASKFLVESSLTREWDHLESPSSRIILGQVVDMGTGSFDLLQNVRV